MLHRNITRNVDNAERHFTLPTRENMYSQGISVEGVLFEKYFTVGIHVLKQVKSKTDCCHARAEEVTGIKFE